MSGSVPGGETAEPNLTPMLDMVFQLITFFMLVINFKAAELDLTLQLPTLMSAKPLPKDTKIKLLVLNVQMCVKCPTAGCDAYATLVREMDDSGKKVLKYKLVCERGHENPATENSVEDGETALSVYRRLLLKEPRPGDIPSIEQYLTQESDTSILAAGLTRADVDKGAELPDYVVIRADSACRYSSVDYIIRECQKLGYRSSLKTGQQDANKNK